MYSCTYIRRHGKDKNKLDGQEKQAEKGIDKYSLEHFPALVEILKHFVFYPAL